MALVALTTTDGKSVEVEPTAVVALIEADGAGACKVLLSSGVFLIAQGSVADTKTALGL